MDIRQKVYSALIVAFLYQDAYIDVFVAAFSGSFLANSLIELAQLERWQANMEVFGSNPTLVFVQAQLVYLWCTTW